MERDVEFWSDSFLKGFLFKNWRRFQFFGEFYFWSIGGVFNVARYLTDSLRGPVLQTLRRAHEVREFDGTDGTDGLDGRVDGNQKCPLIFFILRCIKQFTYIYIPMYI